MTPTENPGLYIHVPFCLSKCPYCDFYSLPSAELYEPFTNALKDEFASLSRLSQFVSDGIRSENIDSVYFGGGTPSALGGRRIADILEAVRSGFRISPDAEITVEANPHTKNPDEFFSVLKAAGVNRISMGLQSAVDSERRSLGRISTASDAFNAVFAAYGAGITDISLDVMLGIPHQTASTLRQTLDFTLNTPITHLSCYMLQIEEGTVFYKKRRSLSLPSDDETASLYEYLCSFAEGHGMRHYEISNFCFDDNVSRHNMKYWTLAPYVGIGPSAHSFFGGRRFYFNRDIRSFIDGEKAVFDCIGGDITEKIMLGLRTDTGISAEDIPEKSKKTVDGYIRSGLMKSSGGRLSLTDSGFLLSNSIITDIIRYIR